MGRLDPYRSERIPEAVEQGYRMCHLQGMICPLSESAGGSINNKISPIGGTYISGGRNGRSIGKFCTGIY